jgi:predicted phage terminase large subunit-like protein
VRDKQWDWYLFDLLPRLKPDGAIILIQTRWHEDDLAGRILSQEADRWTVIKIPMEAEDQDDPLHRAPGERLWPEWFTNEMVNEAKRDSRVWSALYQQRPTPEGGNYFRREWLRPIATLPPRRDLNVYGASDYAVTSSGGDFTVHVIIGMDENSDLYLLDIWREQSASDDWVEAWCDLVRLWKPSQWAEEGGQINASVGPFLKRRARERKAYTYRRQFPPRRDKSVRAQSIRGRMSMNGLFYPAGAPWRETFESELLRFPAGKHDDQVDALGLIGQLLDVIQEGAPRPGPKDLRSTSGYSPWREERDEWPLSAIDI